jgi:hypothetical protein
LSYEWLDRPRRIVAGSNFIPMSKKRHRLPQARPRIVDRIQLAMSIGRHLDGIWIGSWRGRPEDLTRVEGALLLIKQHSPLDYARIARELERVWVYLLPHGLGEYKLSLKACLLDERYVADPATSIEQIACTIVHEATHAWLERYGIGYKEEQRAKIEAICFRRELALQLACPTAPNCRRILHDVWSGIRPIRSSSAMLTFKRLTRRVELKRCVTWGAQTGSSEPSRCPCQSSSRRGDCSVSNSGD